MGETMAGGTNTEDLGETVRTASTIKGSKSPDVMSLEEIDRSGMTVGRRTSGRIGKQTETGGRIELTVIKTVERERSMIGRDLFAHEIFDIGGGERTQRPSHK